MKHGVELSVIALFQALDGQEAHFGIPKDRPSISPEALRMCIFM